MEKLLQTADAYGYRQSDNHPAWNSARRIVPLLVETFKPQSVIDVGCGIGIWLSAFRDAGIADVRGVDGLWVKPEYLVIPGSCFQTTDLNDPLSVVKALGRRFDLALCLEVAEHLPEDRADALTDMLVSLSPLICFSAAVPGQGGYEHVNEQWQSYWANKFSSRGFLAFDIVRPAIAADSEIQFYYRQNIVLYAAKSEIDRCSRIAAELLAKPTAPAALDYVLAAHHASRTNPINYSIRDVIRVLPHLFWRTIWSYAVRK